MAYEPSMKEAATRHYADGKKLQDAKSFNNAGYHFGFAAECATKHLLLNSGVRGDETVIWVHFPELRALAKLASNSRSEMRLYALMNCESFMQEWNTKMRYSAGSAVTQGRAEKWREDADKLMGLLV
jgi:hypothetical protein